MKRKITNITKNEQEGCYMARIMRANKKYQKNFTAKKLGGWGIAKAEALNWVKEMKLKLPSIDETRNNTISSKNTSGVVGVSIRSYEVKRPGGRSYSYWTWIAKWPDCARRGGVRFNVSDKLSDEDAFTLATLARQLRETNREKIKAKFNAIKGTDAQQQILDKKMLYLDWA